MDWLLQAFVLIVPAAGVANIGGIYLSARHRRKVRREQIAIIDQFIRQVLMRDLDRLEATAAVLLRHDTGRKTQGISGQQTQDWPTAERGHHRPRQGPLVPEASSGDGSGA